MYVAVRIRGSVNVRRDVEEGLHRIRLDYPNNCVLLPETEANLGTLRKLRDFIAYGQITAETVAALLQKRGRLSGRRRVTAETVKQLSYDSTEELAKALVDGTVTLGDVVGLNPVFRLRPPRGGHKAVNKHYPEGSLGDWGANISQLLTKMA